MAREGSSTVVGVRRGLVSRVLVYGTLVVIAVTFLMPLVWMVATSLKTAPEASRSTFSLLPTPPSAAVSNAVKNYSDVWNDPTVRFPLYLRNTLIIASLSVIGMTLSSAIVAFGFARLEWRGKKALFAFVLATMMIPFPVVMGPMFLLFSQIGWIGSLKPLWVPAFFANAFNVFMLRQFFMGIPKELDEAARIDGCSSWGIFWRIIVPLSKPALAVVALFHFVFVWNDFLGPLIFLNHQDQFTLALGLQLYQSKAGQTPWNLLMAASTLVIAPVLVVFLLAQGALVKSVATTGIKG
ncbi:MAG: carbohydrate ABC transporter permease [Phycisphaerales bacterium]|nr:carbohydrate ABC transporter permease [Phycisphaerales bacterium]